MVTSPEGGGASFDLSGLSAELESASAALNAFANGPASRAAFDVGEAFERAGAQIEAALRNAAQSGEFDFRAMTTAILEELARLAAEQIFAGGSSGGGDTGASPMNVVVNVAQGAASSDVLGSASQIASSVARAAQRGSRFL